MAVKILPCTEASQSVLNSNFWPDRLLGVRWTPVQCRPEQSAEPKILILKGFRFFYFMDTATDVMILSITRNVV